VTLRNLRFTRKVIVGLIVVFALGCAGAARADLWGYVDDNGVAHFATEPLDSRYRLFFKGSSTLDAPDAGERAEAVSDEAFRRTAIYQRAVNHPNLKRLLPLIERNARLQSLDPALVKAVVAVESGFDPAAVSPKGAFGLMQLLPDTAARYGVIGDSKRSAAQKLLDPAVNLRAGTHYLHDLIVQFADDVSLALAAYNAGEQAVLRYGSRIPPFAETREFVRLVEQFRRLFSPPPPSPPSRLRLKLPDRRGAADRARPAASPAASPQAAEDAGLH
jgi:soluble lytic murein transglycosylase-like protein